MSGPSDVSVVLIARNQRWNIHRLITSVVSEVGSDPDVVLVDSASTDGTPEAAAGHGIRVIRIDDREHRSPSAGRYLGCRETRSELVLFLDGDAELVPGWLDLARRILSDDPSIGSVTGQRISLPISTTPPERPDPPPPSGGWKDVTHCGGSALFVRRALDAAGSFDPWLYSDEEPDLSIRIRHAGYRMVRTDDPMIFDYTDPTDRIRTIVARRGRNLYLGAGQNLRKHLGLPTFRTYVRERGFGILPVVGIPVYLVVCIVAAARSALAFSLTLSLMPVAFAALAVRKRSVQRAARSVVLRLLIAEGTVRGVRLPRREPGAYRPATTEITAP